MEYVQLTLDDYIQCKTEIKENLTGIVKSFVKIGWQLTRINASKAYTLDGYSSITEFAKAEYDMNPDGVSRFMNVYERYSVPGDTPELQEQYKDFKFAQLSEMLQLTEEDQLLITPDTKRADIRELKKFNKENEHNPEQLLNWKTGEDNKIHETIFEFFKSSRRILNDLFGSDAYRAGNIGQMVDIVNPSGTKSYRKNTVFLMMYGLDKGIMVKQIPKGTENMTWSEFFSITQELFGKKATGSRTWEAYFEPESPVENQPKEEEQIPGQDNILNHEEYMPKPVVQKEPEEQAEEESSDSEENETEEQPAAVQENALEEPQPSEENTPSAGIAPAQPHEVVDKPISRKEYLVSLTEYGAADHIAKAFESFGSVTFSQFKSIGFWERWLNMKVDHLGRNWVD